MKPAAKIIKGSGFKVQGFRGSLLCRSGFRVSEVHDERIWGIRSNP
jgi:hypothetical protein